MLSEQLAGFIGCCEEAIKLAFENPQLAVPLPGVQTCEPVALLKAYLLFLATERQLPGGEVEPERFEEWHARLDPDAWRLLGFKRAPSAMSVALAFSLIGRREHQAGELRALIWLVGELAVSDLLPGVSR